MATARVDSYALFKNQEGWKAENRPSPYNTWTNTTNPAFCSCYNTSSSRAPKKLNAFAFGLCSVSVIGKTPRSESAELLPGATHPNGCGRTERSFSRQPRQTAPLLPQSVSRAGGIKRFPGWETRIPVLIRLLFWLCSSSLRQTDPEQAATTVPSHGN